MLGCLGHGDTTTKHSEPALVQSLFGWEVIKIACGNQHTLALTSENEVITFIYFSFFSICKMMIYKNYNR